MKTVYVVRAIPVRVADGAAIGWVRADLLAGGSRPTDKVYLRDGNAYDQAEAVQRLALDPGLLYASEDEAVRDGLARLRGAHVRGQTVPVR